MHRLRSGVVRAAAAALSALLLAVSYPFPSQASQSGVVISEFRVRGPNGAADEFVELHNASNAPVTIGGWRIHGSNSTGFTSTRATIPAGVVLNPGCFYLAANSSSSGGPYSGPVPGNVTYTTGITDDGGIALIGDGVIIDAVGMSNGSAYKEGTPLSSLGSSNLNRSYERKLAATGGHADTDNNANDFAVVTPSNPQNLSSPCLTINLPTSPSGSASAAPSTVDRGSATLLTVAVTAGNLPASTGLTVSADLTGLGGPASQALFDDGSNGDVTAGDLTFSYLATVDAAATPGPKSVAFTIADDQGRTGSASVTVTVSLPAVSAAIHAIQGSGTATPFFGFDVITTGIVTARKADGFFLQTPDGADDADGQTSEGIYVFVGGTPAVMAGDLVRVRGTATEFFNLTEISTTAGNMTVLSSGNPLPAPFTLTPAILDPAGPQLERFEGMRMHAPALVSVAPTGSFGETMTVLEGMARPMREPGIPASDPVPPDPTSGVVDPNIPRWDENPERLILDSDALLGMAVVTVTSNVRFENVTGPLDYNFGAFKLAPEALTRTANMSAVPVPVPSAHELTVAGFNIENFTNGGTTGARQRRKAALAIRDVLHYPDIMGHVEIGSLAALQALAAEVSLVAAQAGHADPMYQARLIPFGTGTQHVGFLVKTSRVNVVSVTQELATEIDPTDGGELHDRPPLVLRATFGATAQPVIVLVNHLRSFIGVEGVDANGARVRAKRTAQAESLARLLQELQVANPGTPVISIGDYNAYEFNDGYTDPIAILKGQPTPDDQIVVDESPDLVNPNFYNLTEELPAPERYTFMFEGTPQALDHMLVNGVARMHLSRYAVARNNADFPETPSALFAGDANRPERNSDHDMPVAYFDFSGPAIEGLSVTPESLGVPDHRMVDVLVSYSASDPSGPVTCGLTVVSNEPADARGDGHTAIDAVVVDPNHVQLRAERSGTGNGRIYTVIVTCTDPNGNRSTASAPVTVRKHGGF
jgi:hypothetical protein